MKSRTVLVYSCTTSSTLIIFWRSPLGMSPSDRVQSWFQYNPISPFYLHIYELYIGCAIPKCNDDCKRVGNYLDTIEHACIIATIRKSRGAVAARRWLATWQRQAAANRDSNSRDTNEHAYILAIIGEYATTKRVISAEIY